MLNLIPEIAFEALQRDGGGFLAAIYSLNL